MADVFISYSQKDRGVVEQFSKKLTERGFSVWYDAEMISGNPFREIIMRELEAAKAVIVVWSQNSVSSRYVQDETEAALSARKLIATRLADLDPSAIPFGFRSIHTDVITDEHRIYAALRGLGVEPFQSFPPRSTPATSNQEQVFAADAVTKLQEIEHWKEIRTSSDPKKFRTFLLQFPKGSFYHHAFEILAKLEWERLPQNPANQKSSWLNFLTGRTGLQPTPDEKAVEAYILEFDGTSEAQAAKTALKSLVQERERNEWSRIKNSREVEDFSRFIAAFPRGSNTAKAASVQQTLLKLREDEEKEWRIVAVEPDLARLRKFRQRFSEGKYAAASADREEELEWQAISDGSDLTAVGNFLKKYPKGRYSGEASARLTSLSSPVPAAKTEKSPHPREKWSFNKKQTLLFWGFIFALGFLLTRS